MTLALKQDDFIADIVDLWDNADASTTIFDTGDLLESYWTGSEVTLASSADTFASKITHPGLTPIATPLGMVAPLAAAAFEAALLAMVLGTTYTPNANFLIAVPNVPVPVGPAIPGVLTATLTAIFLVLSASSKAATIGGHFATYLQSWTAPVSIVAPPSGPVPTPII